MNLDYIEAFGILYEVSCYEEELEEDEAVLLECDSDLLDSDDVPF